MARRWWQRGERRAERRPGYDWEYRGEWPGGGRPPRGDWAAGMDTYGRSYYRGGPFAGYGGYGGRHFGIPRGHSAGRDEEYGP